jgi:MOSC domain-containing protein
VAAVFLSRINYYPFKSLDGQAVESTRLLACGALQHDRRFVIFDTAGKLINGKRTAAVHRLCCEFDPVRRSVVLRERPAGQAASFQIDRQRQELEEWLGEFFDLGGPARIEEHAQGGLPDDLAAPGPTAITEATLYEVASWFPGMTVEEVRARFRPNLEIGGVPAFFEDQLSVSADEVVDFAIGEARLSGTNPCQRCVVPSRWSLTGEVGPERDFAKTFAELRRQTLRPWADASRFDHFYRLAVNTRSADGRACTIRVGDEVRVLGRRRP